MAAGPPRGNCRTVALVFGSAKFGVVLAAAGLQLVLAACCWCPDPTRSLSSDVSLASAPRSIASRGSARDPTALESPRVVRRRVDGAEMFSPGYGKLLDVVIPIRQYSSLDPVTNRDFDRFSRETCYVTVAERTGVGNRVLSSGAYGRPEPNVSWRNASGLPERSAAWESAPVVGLSPDDADAYAHWVGCNGHGVWRSPQPEELPLPLMPVRAEPLEDFLRDFADPVDVNQAPSPGRKPR